MEKHVLILASCLALGMNDKILENGLKGFETRNFGIPQHLPAYREARRDKKLLHNLIEKKEEKFALSSSIQYTREVLGAAGRAASPKRSLLAPQVSSYIVKNGFVST